MSILVLRKKNLSEQREDILFISNQIRRHTIVDGRLVNVEEGLRPLQVAIMLSRERNEWTLEGKTVTSQELTQRFQNYD